ncbi:hypothetical protein RI129_001754 [Pyrocoelia pectoralis]|uniref:Serpin domain-containing protein n=1 Tax=Pyrocoelia pectoralis TaxID=417401 RepID=A0AAN7VK47_9COLE
MYIMRVLLLIATTFATLFAEDQYLESNINFSADIYKEVLKSNNGNFVVCPVSAHIIMSVVSLGAKANTAKQLTKAIYLPDDVNKTRYMFEKLSSKFETNDPYTLSCANKIYVAQGFSINKNYKEIAVNAFKSDIARINFGDNARAADEINSWVESKTNNKIKKLVQKESLNSDTVLVLVNAMYFHGFWLQEFGKTYGHKMPFYVSKTKSVDVEVFGGRNNFNYYHNRRLSAQFLEMPFIGNEVTMTIVLPDNNDGLNRLELHIDDILAEQPYEEEDVLIDCPKFKIETNIDFKAVLQSLGVRDAFTSLANFGGISDMDLLISEVRQKTFIEVNERGATAAAATASYGMIISGPRVVFNVDHPFIFFFRHKDHGILFVGRYIDPDLY